MSLLDTMGSALITEQQTVVHGTTITFTYYKVLTATDLGKKVEHEDVDGENGALIARLIFKRHLEWSGELLCLSGAAPATDFPEGDMCTLTGLTNYFVDSAKASKSKSAEKVSVTLTLIGIT